MASARYLVTGGGGFIGSNIVEALLARGEKVRVIDDFSTGHRKNLDGFDVELIEGSIADADCARRAVEGIEVVFHQAALPSVPRSVKDPLTSDRVNTHGTLTILEAARTAGVRRFLFAGSSSIYGETPELPKRENMLPRPQSPYAVTKLAGEAYLSAYALLHGMETLTLRYFNVFGPRQDPASRYAGVIPLFISQIKRGEPPRINGDGSITRDFTYIDNVVDATKRAGIVPEARGKVFNAACGTSFSLMELVAAINGALGTAIAPTHGPERKGDIKASRADISLAQSILGYEPHVSFEEGIRRTVASFA